MNNPNEAIDGDDHGLSNELLTRAQGCLLGQLAGDALGSLVEFQTVHQIQHQYPDGVRILRDGGTWNTLAGQPTDDSELALMLARTLVRSGFDDQAIAAAYAHWYESDPFDIGATTQQALSAASIALQTGTNPAIAAQKAASTTSQANGALMRISPLAIYGHAMSESQLVSWAKRDAQLTHPHGVCQDANAVFVMSIRHALTTGASPQAVYTYAKIWAEQTDIHPTVVDAITEAAHQPPSDYSHQMGWVRIALHNAFYQLLHAPTLEEGIVNTVMQGGDTDTNGAIVGALLGAVYGYDAIPAQWRDRILNCRPEAGAVGVYRPRPPIFWTVDALQLAEELLLAGV